MSPRPYLGIPRIGLTTARSDSCYRETSNRIPEERLSIFHITRDTTSAFQFADRLARPMMAGGIAGGVAITVATNVALMLLALISGTLSARLLGVAGRGELASVQLWASLALTIGVFGLPSALTYYAAREPESAGRYFSTSLLMMCALAPLLCGTFYALMPVLLSAQSAQTVHEARIYLLFIPLGAVTGFSVAVVQGGASLIAWNALRLGAALAWFAVLIVAAGTRMATPWMIAQGYLFAVALMGIVFLFVVRRQLKGPFTPTPKLLVPLYRYAFPSSLATLPQQSVFRLDQILIAALLDQRALGLYVVAVTWSTALSPLSAAFSSVVFPHVARLQSREHQVATVGRVLRASVIVNLILLVPLLVSTPLAIRLLFGNEFHESVPAALILVLAAAVGNVKSIFGEGARGLGTPSVVMWSELLGFAAMGAVLVTTLTRAGLFSAAIASLVGNMVTAGALLMHSRRLPGMTARAIMVPRRADWTAL